MNNINDWKSWIIIIRGRIYKREAGEKRNEEREYNVREVQ